MGKTERITGWLAHLNGQTAAGIAVYAVIFAVAAVFLSRLWARGIRGLVAQDRDGRIDRMSANFLTQIGRVFIWMVALMLFAHAVPALERLATALLASVSIAGIVIGLAVQSTLSNLAAGVGLIFYRPFSLGDRLQVTAPTGPETGTVESVSLGYTVLATWDSPGKRCQPVPGATGKGAVFNRDPLHQPAQRQPLRQCGHQ